MNIGPFELAMALLLPALLGIAVLRLLGIGPRRDPVAFLGWAWIAGTLGTGLVVFGWLWTGLGTDSALLPAVAVLLLSVWCLVLARPPAPAPAPAPTHTFPRWERGIFFVVLGLGVLVVLERILVGTLIPVLVGDEGEFWALKSKIIYESGGFNADFRAALSDPMRILYHKDYPLLNPLLQVWTFAFGGQITHVANRLPIQLFALAQLLIVAGALRRVVRPLVAAALIPILLAPPLADDWSHQAMADLMVAVGAVTIFDAWHRWHEEEDPAWFRLGAVALALMLWSKNEGLFFCLCITGALIVSVLLPPRRLRAIRSRGGWRWLLLPVGVLGLHFWFNSHHGFVSAFSESEEGSLLTLFLERVADYWTVVVDFFGRELALDPSHSNLLLACFAGLVIACPLTLWRSRLCVPTAALLVAWLGFVAIFIAHPIPPQSTIQIQLQNAAPRVTFQLYACMVLWVGAAAAALSPLLRAPAPAAAR